MTIAAILDRDDWISTYLVNVDEGASEKEILEAIAEKMEYSKEGFDAIRPLLNWFELEPLAAERLKELKWPKTYVDADMHSQALHMAVVYAAFAKGGPASLKSLDGLVE